MRSVIPAGRGQRTATNQKRAPPVMDGMVRTVASGDGRCPLENELLHLRFFECQTIGGAGAPARAAVTGQNQTYASANTGRSCGQRNCRGGRGYCAPRGGSHAGNLFLTRVFSSATLASHFGPTFLAMTTRHCHVGELDEAANRVRPTPDPLWAITYTCSGPDRKCQGGVSNESRSYPAVCLDFAPLRFGCCRPISAGHGRRAPLGASRRRRLSMQRRQAPRRMDFLGASAD